MDKLKVVCIKEFRVGDIQSSIIANILKDTVWDCKITLRGIYISNSCLRLLISDDRYENYFKPIVDEQVSKNGI